MSTSHHGSPPQGQPAVPSETMKRLLDQLEGRAQREYSKGRLNADDDGTLSYAIAADKKGKRIIIDFGKDVSWIGLAPDDVNNLINALKGKLNELGEPCIINV